MITDTLPDKIQNALKEKDTVRLSTLKLLSSELHNKQIEKRGELTEDEELKVIKSEAKKRQDAIEIYKKANRSDKAKQEEDELKILKEFLPKELPHKELEEIVDDAVKDLGAASLADMGKVMSLAMQKVAGRAGGGAVSEIVRKKLT